MKSVVLLQTDWLIKRYLGLIQTISLGFLKSCCVKKNASVVKITPRNLRIGLLFFRNHSLCSYKQLIDIAAEDRPTKSHRFRLNYILSSLTYNQKIIITLTIDELSYLPSVTSIFSSASWLEREVWDLFGVYFNTNRNLARILTDYGFSGHPLRKDFPLSGFYEVYYSLATKRLVTEPVEFMQEYRLFSL